MGFSMSGTAPPAAPFRGVVYEPLRFDESVGKPFVELSYLTPRFPAGIKESDLATANEGIQRETMIVWFLANFVPATGPYFGFAEAGRGSSVLNTSPLNTFTFNSGPKIAGFSQAPFFNGGRAPELIESAFARIVSAERIAEVANLFDGIWERNAAKPPVATESVADVRAAVVAVLDALKANVEKLSPAHGGIGHNRPDEDLPLAGQEQITVLRAISETRLAVLSGSDYSVVDAVWRVALQVTRTVGAWAAKQVNTFVDGFVSEGGKALGKKLPYIVGTGVEIWDHGEKIQRMLQHLSDNLLK
jgi:hypothetical protein